MERFMEGKNLNKVLLGIGLVLVLAILAGDVCYIVLGTLIAKSLTSACFVILGVVCFVYAYLNKLEDKKFRIALLVGLVMAMLGDILLEIEFVVGAAFFALGHVCFFISYCFLAKLKWKDFLFGAIIFVPSVLFITLAPIFDFGGVLMEVVCVVYAIIISCMVGKSISNLVQARNVLNIVLVIGSILFFFSDLMLLLNVFANLGKVVGVLCLATYYPAEILLAGSIALMRREVSEN